MLARCAAENGPFFLPLWAADIRARVSADIFRPLCHALSFERCASVKGTPLRASESFLRCSSVNERFFIANDSLARVSADGGALLFCAADILARASSE
jgi:hypothetical protein